MEPEAESDEDNLVKLAQQHYLKARCNATQLAAGHLSGLVRKGDKLGTQKLPQYPHHLSPQLPPMQPERTCRAQPMPHATATV